ncbi:MAG: hypothetical protein GXO31_07400 [Epsilonproteobacteria bacterium]|nr:hypothetical protein [Campylobacterota bacterium]
MENIKYKDKFEKFIQNSRFKKLTKKDREFLEKFAYSYKLSYQELRTLIDIAVDFGMWREKGLWELVSLEDKPKNPKVEKKKIIDKIKKRWEELKYSPMKFDNFKFYKPRKISLNSVEKKELGFGSCPVASIRTRCCNLLTLDAVESCGFDCSYCSIQSFYNEDKIVFDKNFKENLQKIKLDPNEIYHIGTGQSSDSLMWGNREGILDALFEFARKNENVILELKSKSDNISYFLENDVPRNIICTWSLNPQTVIDHEEHLTASLENRLKAAKKLHDKGVLVGFHFHPMIYYEGWQEGYKDICDRLLRDFDPKNVVMVSIGTLTFIKSVIKKIRDRDFYSKILQIPMVDADGKLSYPKDIKVEMFKYLYDSLSLWHGKVYFYMCMENHSLWKEVFGFEYPTNESFEMDMKLNYRKKIIER